MFTVGGDEEDVWDYIEVVIVTVLTYVQIPHQGYLWNSTRFAKECMTFDLIERFIHSISFTPKCGCISIWVHKQ